MNICLLIETGQAIRIYSPIRGGADRNAIKLIDSKLVRRTAGEATTAASSIIDLNCRNCEGYRICRHEPFSVVDRNNPKIYYPVVVKGNDIPPEGELDRSGN